MNVETQNSAPQPQAKEHSLMTLKIGPLPLPIYLILAVIIYTASVYSKLPADMIGGIAVLMILGMLLGDIGMRVPVLKDIGGPAILSIFVPSIMLFYNLINPASLKAITAFMKGSNFLYFYISCLIVGSILGMQRAVLIQGFVRMFFPLLVGTLGCIAVGVTVGTLTGIGAYHSFFYVVVPIISGGVGEGILPLSMAYADITGLTNDKFIPQLVPAAMLGNLFAIMAAGYLRRLGEKKPQLTGNGVLVKTGNDDLIRAAQTAEKPVDFSLMGAGLILAMSFFVFGQVVSLFIPIPAPIIMIFSAAILKALGIMPAKMEQGAYHLYRFVTASLTWPLLVGVGVMYTPWKDVVAAITPAYVVTVFSTVAAMIAAGFYVAKPLKMYSVESAVVTACHSGLGGTGDVAILSASNRIELMPFAQVSTRLGGACMVVIAAIFMRLWS
ncbi:2-hydroxycarboxylate transporter family protein [Sporomusa acidovorans]|uniref:Citrate/malate transporter n=1 Tax=Sporomusa acidovorans (strain ATCC 49682 / DSM 3132 / Mol) TaxID=1123286 RepID=A0ABZ3J8Q5_SPOA4|nr:2-hydroxycarboxylate transporter family protein [Sporomusa acidovorans]OZC16169.1 citrate/malate transporter [Sporomusa acidovorans DSM 3132]SDE29747.1 malate:Na+ symporter [Sporomusa acidovorans]